MEIHINPANEPRRVLLALAAMLTTLAGDSATLAPADRPDAGAELKAGGTTQARILPDGGELKPSAPADLAAAFGGAGNVAGSSPTALSPPPALIGAGSPTIQIPTSEQGVDSPAPDLAAAFGGSNSGPNVAPLMPPAGAPPAPPNGAPTAGASTQVETDKEGLPWDSRIHSSNKKKAATGIWMARRGVDPMTSDQIKAQLKAAMSVGNAQPPAGAPPPPPPLVTPTPIPLPETTPSAAGSDAITLPMLLPRITTAMAAGHLTADTAGAIAMELSGGKINNVAMLAVAPQLIPAFWQRLDQLGVA